MGSPKAEKTNKVHGTHVMQEVQGEGEVGFFDILLIVKRHWLLIFLVFILVMCLVMYKYITTTSLYQSKAILLIGSRNTRALMDGSGFNTNTMEDQSYLNTMVAILQNDQVLKATWEALNEDPETRSVMVDEAFRVGPAAWGQYVLDHLSIKLGGDGDIKKANVFQVAYVSTSPKEAYVVIRELINQFQKYFEGQYRKTTDVIGATIRQGRDDLDKAIKDSTDELANFIRDSKTSFLGDQTNNTLLTRLQSLEANLVTLDFQRLKYVNRLNMIEAMTQGRDLSEISDEEIITILGSGEDTEGSGGMDPHLSTLSYLAQGGKLEDSLNSTLLQLDLQQSTNMLMEIANLKVQNVGEENPKIVALLNAYEELRRLKKEKTGLGDELATVNKIGIFTYQALLSVYVNVLRERISALGKQRKQVQDYIDSQDPKIREISEYCQKVESMKFTIDSQKEFYLQLDRKLDQVLLIRNYGGYQIEVMAPPRESVKPISPNLMKFLLVGTVLGLICGFALAFISDMTDTTFRTPEEVATSLRVPLLAQLPRFQVSKRSIRELKTTQPGIPIPSLIVYHFPNSPQCEVFRALRTMLFFNPNGVNPRIVMCSSPHSGDGKSMFAVSMAIKLADAGKKVLFLDGDIRKPDIHKWFSWENEDGFADILAGAKSVEEVVRPTGVKNLSAITAGIRRKNPSELLTSKKLDETLDRLREMFDFVIVDSSPVLYVSDPCNIASKVDGVLYLFRIRRRGRPDVIQGIQMLADIGAKFLGCVVNCHDKHRFYDEFAIAKKRPYGNPFGDYGVRSRSGNKYGYGGYGYGFGYGGYGYGFGYGNKKYGDAAKVYMEGSDDRLEIEDSKEGATKNSDNAPS